MANKNDESGLLRGRQRTLCSYGFRQAPDGPAMLDNSPARRMMTARRPVPSKGICRCLFGPIDHDENKKTLNRINQMLDDRDQSIWNFNFKTETPMFGRFDWQRVGTDREDVPRAYEMPHLNPDKTESPNDPQETARPTVTVTHLAGSTSELRALTPTPDSSSQDAVASSSKGVSVQTSETTSPGQSSPHDVKVAKRKLASQTTINEYFRPCKRSKASFKS